MAKQGDYRKNAEYLSGIVMYDKVSQEKQVEYLAEFLQPFSFDDQCRIINHKLERYHGRTAVHLAALHGLHLPLQYLLRQGGACAAERQPLRTGPLPHGLPPPVCR